MSELKLKLSQKQHIFAHNASRLIQFIISSNYNCSFGEAFRTKEQAILNSKNGTGIVNSLHCKRLAIDLNLFDSEGKYLTDSESYQHAGEYWESLHPNNCWGGRFKSRPDGNHFQMNE